MFVLEKITTLCASSELNRKLPRAKSNKASKTPCSLLLAPCFELVHVHAAIHANRLAGHEVAVI